MALFLRLSEEERASFRDYYRNNDLFRHWSPILCHLEREYGCRDAISLWACSEQCLNRLKQVSQYRETEIDYILRELLQECDVMTTVTVMCVVLIRLMNAVEKGHEDETFSNEPICTAIMSILMNSRAYKPIYDGINNLFFERKIGFDDNPVVIQPSDPMHETLIGDDFVKGEKEQSSKMKQFDTNTDDIQMSEDYKPTYINEQHNNNCQQFFGPIMNCTFTMPAASTSLKKASSKENGRKYTQSVIPKQEKQHGLEYPVFSKGSGVTDDHIKAVYIMLTTRGWISTQTNEVDFKRLFSGKSNDCEIIWTGQDKQGGNEPTALGISALYVLFKTMYDAELITTSSKTQKVGPIIESHFVDSDGHYLTNVSNVSTTSAKAKDYIKQIIHIMQIRHNTEDIQRVLQEETESRYDKNDRQDLNYRRRC